MTRLRRRGQEILLTAPAVSLAVAFLPRPDRPGLHPRLSPRRPLRRHRPRLDPGHPAGAGRSPVPGHRLADPMGQLHGDGDLHAAGRAHGLCRRPRPGASPQPPAHARHRPLLDQLPHPRLRLEVDPPSRGTDQESPRLCRPGRCQRLPAVSPGGGHPGDGLHLPAVRHPADLCRGREVRLSPDRGGPRPWRPPLRGVSQGVPARGSARDWSRPSWSSSSRRWDPTSYRTSSAGREASCWATRSPSASLSTATCPWPAGFRSSSSWPS